ncbi:sugar ABC transporter permease [Nonomuraea sp. NPDC055795]
MTARHSGGAAYDEAAVREYVRCFSDPAAIAASCADYRAAAGVDLEHDEADAAAGRRVRCPVLALWGEHSFVGRAYDVLKIWREYADHLTGTALPSDHYLPEEAPALVNRLLELIGVQGPAWLQDQRTALPSIIVMTAWRGFGFDMVVFLAALQGIPRELYEAAEVDGAGRWQRFWSITVPQLRPVILFCTIYSTVGFLQFMEEPLVMTGGGPLNSTLSVSLAIWKQFGVGNYGYAGAAATVLFTVIIALAVLQLRIGRSR